MSKQRRLIAGTAVTVLVGLGLQGTLAQGASADPGKAVVVNYDASTDAQYAAKWSNIYGPLELAAGGTRTVSGSAVTVKAVPFHLGVDQSVFDHLKYIGVSNETFPVPASGSVRFSVDITADTPGTQPGRVIHGCYGPAWSYPSLAAPCAQPWSSDALEGQQAGVVLNMIDFGTGQLFDWFLSSNTAFPLIERLPSNVTGSGNVGLDKAYTQIIKEIPITQGTHNVAIEYTRNASGATVEYFLDGASVAKVSRVGVPLDKQPVPYTGIYPSYGNGEELSNQVSSFAIGHGLFSLLDAFPFQHPDRPDLSVSIPPSERAFGQGAIGTWKHFKVTTRRD